MSALGTGATRMPPSVVFPLSFALHIAEEAWAGETFPVWASRVSGASFSREEFVVLNGVAFALMCVAVAASSRWPRTGRTILPALGTIVGGNGALHLVASLWTSSYSPGAISGAMVWLPLGIWTLRAAARSLPVPQFVAACVAGVLAHAAISAIALAH